MYTPVEEGEVMEKQLPEAIAAHLKELVSGDEEALRRLEDLWMEKIRIFEEQIRLLGMDFVESVDADDERGMILTTYSGHSWPWDPVSRGILNMRASRCAAMSRTLCAGRMRAFQAV
jgi:hypothetical protein